MADLREQQRRFRLRDGRRGHLFEYLLPQPGQRERSALYDRSERGQRSEFKCPLDRLDGHGVYRLPQRRLRGNRRHPGHVLRQARQAHRQLVGHRQGHYLRQLPQRHGGCGPEQNHWRHADEPCEQASQRCIYDPEHRRIVQRHGDPGRFLRKLQHILLPQHRQYVGARRPASGRRSEHLYHSGLGRRGMDHGLQRLSRPDHDKRCA